MRRNDVQKEAGEDLQSMKTNIVTSIGVGLPLKISWKLRTVQNGAAHLLMGHK